MTESQVALNFALRMYGEAMVANAAAPNKDTYDNMCFWQNQAWMLAKELAEEQKS